MPTEYTVIAPHRHVFGDRTLDPGSYSVDDMAHFDGPSADFEFRCPDVHSGHEGILQFQYRGSQQRLRGFKYDDPEGRGSFGITDEHPIEINGFVLSGGVPGSPHGSGGWWAAPLWSMRSLIVPVGVLREVNLIKFESKHTYVGENLDDFTIDNVVIFYRTSGRHGSTPPNAGVEQQ